MQNANHNDSSRQCARVVQITDSHLFESQDALLTGLNCQESFAEVVSLIRQQQAQIDCLLCTGDIAQDASLAGYQRFYETVAGFRAPQLWIPGNHDIVSNMIEAVGRDNPCLEKVFRLNQWLIIMLDTSVRGEVHGYLAPDELVFLDHQLKASGNQQLHVLICMHHNPMPVQARWLQNHSLKNEAEFFAVIDRYEHVKCVLWGHIHQDYDEVRKDVRMLASPSTCIQFHPDNDEFTLDDVNPGYRWLELKPGGDFKTGVERVTGRTFDIDFSSRGY